MKKGHTMQIRAYINPGPHIVYHRGCGYRVGGTLPVSDAETNPYVLLPSSVLYTGHISDELAALIRHYSILDQIDLCRVRGVYTFKDARAVVTFENNKFWVEANGQTLKTVAKLVLKTLG